MASVGRPGPKRSRRNRSAPTCLRALASSTLASGAANSARMGASSFIATPSVCRSESALAQRRRRDVFVSSHVKPLARPPFARYALLLRFTLASQQRFDIGPLVVEHGGQ